MQRLRAVNRKDAWLRLREWPRNLLYYHGEQRIAFDNGEMRWVRKNPNRRQKRYEANLLGARGDHYVADLTQTQPRWTGVPENTDLSSRQVAMLAERVLMHDWRELDVESARLEAVSDSMLFGSGFIEVGWDPYAGRVKTTYVREMSGGKESRDEMGLPVFKRDKEGKPVIESSGYEGQFFCRSVSPFLVFVPPNVESPRMEACQWVIRIEWKTEYQIREMATKKLPMDWDPGLFDPEFQYTDQMVGYQNSARQQPEDGLHLVAHYYERACDVEGFEGGKHYVVVNQRVIAEGPLDSLDGTKYPLYLFRGRRKAKSFWSHAWIKDQVEPQARRNHVLTHLVSWLEKFALPNILAPKGSGFPETMESAGRTYFYNPTAGPAQWMTPPPPSSAVFNMLQESTKELDDVSGDYPAGRGQGVSAPSALYLQYLQDAGSKRIGPTVRAHAWSYARMGEHLLELHQLYDSNERLLTIIGKGNRPQLVTLRKDLPLGKVKLVVQETSLLSIIPSARVDQVNGMIKNGMFNAAGQPPPAPVLKALLAYMNLPDLSEMETGNSVSDRWAENILSKLIEEGQVIQPDPLWGPQQYAALAEAFEIRKLREDRDDWDPATVQRCIAFDKMLQEQIAMAKKAELAAQREAMQVEVDAKSAIEASKNEAVAKRMKDVEYAKKRAEVIGNLATGLSEQTPKNGAEKPSAEGGSNATTE